jgi:hypothetical protein
MYGKIEFPVNEPVLLDPKNRAHGAIQLMPIQVPHPQGSGTAMKHQETWVFWGDILKEHPDFEVEGHPRAVRLKPVGKVPAPGAQWHEDHAGDIAA